MGFSIKFVPLFKVSFLHRFFLNRGEIEFSAMNIEDRERQINMYNIHDCFSILPTSTSLKKITGYNLVLKKGNTGFSVWTKVDENDNKLPFVKLDSDLSFTFTVQIKDATFYNYTKLNMENNGKLYYLSNRRLPSEAVSFPLIGKTDDNTVMDDSFLLTDESTAEEWKALQWNERKNLLAIIRIYMKADSNALHVIDGAGKIVEPFINYEVVLKNRKTFWRYFFNNDQQVVSGDDVKKENGNARILVTKSERPLTQKGFISVELDGTDLPNPSAKLVKPGTSNEFYSDIYM